jgi:hypothetical protein
MKATHNSKAATVSCVTFSCWGKANYFTEHFLFKFKTRVSITSPCPIMKQNSSIIEGNSPLVPCRHKEGYAVSVLKHPALIISVFDEGK